MKLNEPWNRRDMMRALAMGVAGTAAIPASVLDAFAKNPESALAYRSRGGRSLYQHPAELSSAALIKGNDRSENIFKALKLIEDQVLSGIKGKQILIKPNFVQTSNQLAATHVDAIRGIQRGFGSQLGLECAMPIPAAVSVPVPVLVLGVRM